MFSVMGCLEMSKLHRVAVIGSRDFKHYGLLCYYLDNFFFHPKKKIEIISGGAIGADSLAEKFAEARNIKTKVYKANWDKHGKRAGFLRNKKIVKNCDVVVAFWDGESKGTKITIDLAKEAGKKVYIIMSPGE